MKPQPKIKMKKNLLVFILALSCLLFEKATAQDPMFSQFYSAPLYLNPAMAGAETNMIIGVNYRTQWTSLQFPYQTGQVSFTYPLITNASTRKHIGGIGGSVFNEVAGQNHNFKTYGIVLGGAYNLQFDKWRNTFISFGLQGGLIQKQIDNGVLTWGSQYDPFFGYNPSIAPTINNINQTTMYPVVNAGITLFHNSQKIHHGVSSFVGFAVSNLNRPNESMIQNARTELPFLFKINGGLDIAVSERITVSPNVLWMQQNSISQINAGLYGSYSLSTDENPFIATIGTWYRLQDSLIGMIGLSKDKLTFGFSYDINSSTLRYASQGQGTYEVSLTYRVPKIKGLRRFATPLI
jgi:type IX secretion system PorP/SprF family membrane protein